jgi:hypothetical protein
VRRDAQFVVAHRRMMLGLVVTPTTPWESQNAISLGWPVSRTISGGTFEGRDENSCGGHLRKARLRFSSATLLNCRRNVKKIADGISHLVQCV